MTGSEWSYLGVVISVVGGLIVVLGTLIAAHGARVSDREAESKSDQVIAQGEELASKSDQNAKLSQQVIAKAEELASKSDEIAKLNREVADLSQKYAAYALGTGSYFYLHIGGFGESSRRAEIRHIGTNPVRDTEILIFDITHQIADLATKRVTRYDLDDARKRRYFVEASYAGRPKVLSRPAFEANPTLDTYAYFVNLEGANGAYRQVIQLKRVGDVWKQAYVVERVLVDDTREPIGQFFDEGFPIDGESIIRPAVGYPRLR